jgi:hypothetical protein
MATLKKPKPQGVVRGWSEVYGALWEDSTRSRVLEAMRAQGITTNMIASQPTARLALADILSATEDWLELSKPKASLERKAIRVVRRKLEWEIWP